MLGRTILFTWLNLKTKKNATFAKKNATVNNERLF